jgi:hypothetical protein
MNGAANGNADIVIAALLVIGREILSDRTKNKKHRLCCRISHRHRHDASNPFAATAAIRRVAARRRNECCDDRPNAR